MEQKEKINNINIDSLAFDSTIRSLGSAADNRRQTIISKDPKDKLEQETSIHSLEQQSNMMNDTTIEIKD